MNRRTRRGTALVALGLAAAVVASQLFAGALAKTQRATRLDGAWLVVTKALEPYETITPSVTVVQRVPSQWVPDAALPPDAASAGWVAASPLPPGAVLQSGMVQPAISTSGRAREVTVRIDGGLQIKAGQLVDVYGGFNKFGRSCSALLAPNAQVVDVAEHESLDPATGSGQVTVLLSVRKDLVARVVYGSFNGALRLVSIPPGKTSSARASKACGVPSPDRETRRPRHRGKKAHRPTHRENHKKSKRDSNHRGRK